MDFLLRSKSNVSRLPSRKQVMHAYRGILREARAFFDENTRDFITSYTRKEFRKNLYDKKTARAQRKIKGARTTLHLLERANAHKFKDVISVLEYGYGRKGPRKVEMLQATAKIRPRERVFGNLREVAKYRPAFYAIAERQFGVKKLTVSEEPLKSKHPLNVAKMQDRHWEHIRHRTVPPIDQSTMDLIEERARTGSVTNILLKSKDISADDAEMLQMWEQRWVKKPNKSQVIRYYRALLDINMAVMDVSVEMVPNKGKYWKAMPRRNVLDASGAVKPDLIPKKAFTFRTSSLAGKKSPSSANGIDVLNLPPSSV